MPLSSIYNRLATALIICLLVPFKSFPETVGTKEDSNTIKSWMQKNSFLFEENKGQFSENTLFKASCGGTDIYVTTKGITYTFYKKISSPSSFQRDDTLMQNTKWEYCRVNMNLKNAGISTQNIVKENSSIADINYYNQYYPKGIQHVKCFKSVTIKNIYPGIDWVLYASYKDGFKYDFVIHPGASPNNIHLEYEGAKNIEAASGGKQVIISTALGKIKEGDLLCYQDTITNPVSSSYKIRGNQIDLAISGYDETKKLIIDPPVLTWSTYFGGSGSDEISFSITADKLGHVFVTGDASNTPNNMPTLNPGAANYFQGIYGGGFNDAFILKFDTSGVLICSTYFGGSAGDRGVRLCVDNTNNIFVTGYTYSFDFPITSGAFQSTNHGSQEGFIAKFDNAGALLWSTYMGGSLPEYPRAIAADNTGNVFCTGRVRSTDMTVKNPGSGAYYNGVHAPGVWDAFIWEFSVTGNLIWSTYYGGSGTDEGYALTVDLTDNLWVTGVTTSVNTFTLNSPGAYFQGSTGGGGSDAFIAKFTNAGVLVLATYYGGGGGDDFRDITKDQLNNIWMTGSTTSNDFPLQDPGGGAYFQPALGNTNGNFSIVKLSNAGAKLWSTYYGGTNANFFSDVGWGIITDNKNDVWVTGTSSSTNSPAIPICGAFYQSGNNALVSNGDGFIAQFNNAGVRKWASYYGGDGQDNVYAIAYSAPNSIFITGFALSYNLITVDPGGTDRYFQSSRAGGTEDIFIAKFQDIPLSLTPITIIHAFDSIICTGECLYFADSTKNFFPTNWQWSFPGAVTPSSTLQNPYMICYNVPGVYSISLTASNACQSSTASKIAFITVNQFPLANAGADDTICAGDIVVLTASGGASYLWNTGATTAIISIPISTPTTFSVIVSNGNCKDNDEVSIFTYSLAAADAGADDTICQGYTAILTASGGTNYLWNTGATTAVISVPVSVTTSFTVTVSNGICTDNDEATIFIYPLVVDAGNDASILLGSNVILNGTGTGTYNWNPSSGLSCTSCQQPTAQPSATTTYYLTVTDNHGCSITDSVIITVDRFCEELFIPTAFSPNNDGQNDVFSIKGTCIQSSLLRIYDRWGEKVFETTDILSEWDGSYKGKKLRSGIFIYSFEAVFRNQETLVRRGNISLIR